MPELIGMTDVPTYETDENVPVPSGAYNFFIFSRAGGIYKIAPNGTISQIQPRQVLSAARTYYVRTDGNDSNTGLANTAGGAFLTIQKAVDTVASLDINGQTVTIQIADGTYTGAIVLKNVPGFATAGSLVIQGNNGTPSNVVISTTSNSCFSATGITSVWDLKDMKLQTATSGHCIVATGACFIRFSNLVFGACASYHMNVGYGAIIQATGNYSVSGAATRHMYGAAGGIILIQSRTVTVTASIALPWVDAGYGCNFLANGNTYSLGGNTVTGVRYSVVGNSVVFTNGGGASYFPGDSAGSTATGGQYI